MPAQVIYEGHGQAPSEGRSHSAELADALSVIDVFEQAGCPHAIGDGIMTFL